MRANEIAELARKSFTIDRETIRENLPTYNDKDLDASMTYLARDHQFRRIGSGKYTIYADKDLKNIELLREAKRKGSHVILEGRKNDGTEYRRKGAVDGFAFPTKKRHTLVRIQDELQARFSSFIIEKIRKITIVGPKPFQK